jgi:hypothetical protein
MKKYNRSWGNTALAWLIVASLVAPTAALAWTPTGDKPIDNGDEPGQPGMEAVGDPDNSSGGRPQPIIEDMLFTWRAMIDAMLYGKVDQRLLVRLSLRQARQTQSSTQGRWTR